MQDNFSNSATGKQETNTYEDCLILYFIREDQTFPEHHAWNLDTHFRNIMARFEKEYKQMHHSNWEFEKHFFDSYINDCARFVASELVDGLDFNCDQFIRLNSKFNFSKMGTTITVVQSTGFNGAKPDINAANQLG